MKFHLTFLMNVTMHFYRCFETKQVSLQLVLMLWLLLNHQCVVFSWWVRMEYSGKIKMNLPYYIQRRSMFCWTKTVSQCVVVVVEYPQIAVFSKGSVL